MEISRVLRGIFDSGRFGGLRLESGKGENSPHERGDIWQPEHGLGDFAGEGMELGTMGCDWHGVLPDAHFWLEDLGQLDGGGVWRAEANGRSAYYQHAGCVVAAPAVLVGEEELICGVSVEWR